MNTGIQGWMASNELLWLEECARRMDSVAEIGCWKGRSTYSLAEHCPGPVYAVDHWLGSEDERMGPHKEATERDIFADFMGNVGHFPNLRVRRGASTEVAATLPMVDMAFIDAGHRYEDVVADLDAWAPKTLRLLAGHDYDYPGVGRAVKERFGDRVKGGPGSIWYVEYPNPPRVMIATPAYAMAISAPYVISLLELMSAASRYRMRFEWQTTADSLIGRGRIRLFSKFLASQCTHLLFIDSDLKFKPESVFDLIRWSKPLVGGVYPCKSIEPKWPANFITGEDREAIVCPETGCVLAHDLPTGFMLIRRDCAERMVAAYPETKCRIEPDDSPVNEHAYNLFDQPVDTNGILLSEDFAFCRKWQAIGGEVWIDPQIKLVHYGAHGFDHGSIADSVLVEKQEEPVAA